MLDDADYINRIDSDDALGVAAKQPEQLSFSPAVDLKSIGKDIDTIVVVGMGGSALAADMGRNWWQSSLDQPFEVVRGYSLPEYVGEKTLVVCSSYSGNTEETLSGLQDALKRKAQVLIIASGGELSREAEENDLSFVGIPEGYQPRMAAWYSLKVLAIVFEELGLVEGAIKQLEEAESLLFAAASEWGREVPTIDNYAKKTAEQLMGKAVWVYAGTTLASAAYKWKIDFNENAKTVASNNVLPEFNHNEYLGWTSHPVEKPFGVVELKSNLDHPQIVKRFEVSNRLLSGQMPAPIEVEAKGSNQIEQLLWASLLGDLVSIYCGILNGVNPTKVEPIEKLKREL